jgi:hypothetical protein
MPNSETQRQRRELLIVRSALLRATWALQVQALRRPLGMADKARDSVHWLVNHPQWPLGVLAGLLLLRPQRVLRLASLGWWGWNLFQRVRRLLPRI